MSLLKSWKYINEGNVHIVLQIENTNYVLRLIKENGKPISLRSVQKSMNFINLVMNPLLSQNNYGLQEIVNIPETQLEELGDNLLKIRPKHRIVKSILSQYAIKTLNLAILSPNCEVNYCIEIKPKEGFLSSNLLEYGKCYYCLKQFMKLQDNKIKNVSEYCPLDLFSGKKPRMRRALLNLVSNPQNNFKLLRNGCVMYHEESSRTELDDIISSMGIFESSSELFFNFVIEILLSDGISNINIVESEQVIEIDKTEQCIEDDKLPTTSFLSKLLTLQKLSEPLKYDLSNIEEDLGYVSTMLEQLNSNNYNLNDDNDQRLFLTTSDSIHLALIAAVAKDCSIMISFTTNCKATENLPNIQVGCHKVAYRVAVTDLEPKPMKTLTKRAKTERMLLDIYKKVNFKENKC